MIRPRRCFVLLRTPNLLVTMLFLVLLVFDQNIGGCQAMGNFSWRRRPVVEDNNNINETTTTTRSDEEDDSTTTPMGTRDVIHGATDDMENNSNSHSADDNDDDDDMEKTYLELFGQQAKEFFTHPERFHHLLNNNKSPSPSPALASTSADNLCRWDWRYLRCEPYCACAFQVDSPIDSESFFFGRRGRRRSVSSLFQRRGVCRTRKPEATIKKKGEEGFVSTIMVDQTSALLVSTEDRTIHTNTGDSNATNDDENNNNADEDGADDEDDDHDDDSEELYRKYCIGSMDDTGNADDDSIDNNHKRTPPVSATLFRSGRTRIAPIIHGGIRHGQAVWTTVVRPVHTRYQDGLHRVQHHWDRHLWVPLHTHVCADLAQRCHEEEYPETTKEDNPPPPMIVAWQERVFCHQIVHDCPPAAITKPVLPVIQ